MPTYYEALQNVTGVYCLTDRKTGKLYIGSATGEQGVADNYEARLLETLIEERLEQETREAFGADVVIRASVLKGYLNDEKIDFDNFNFEEYMIEENPDIVLDIFINRENDSQDGEVICNYVSNMKNHGMGGRALCAFYYVKEDKFKDVESQYAKLYDPVGSDKEFSEYFLDPEVIYTSVLCKIEDGVIRESIEELNEELRTNTGREY